MRMLPQTSFILTHLLFIVTCIAAGALTQLQASYHRVASAAHYVKYTASDSAPLRQVNTDTTDISDSILFAWAAGGSLCGAYIGIAVGLSPMSRKPDEKVGPVIAKAFAVSLLTGILLTPYLAHHYLKPVHWSTVLLLGGGTAAGAWLLWAAFTAILKRFVQRAETQGLTGVIEEARGNRAEIVAGVETTKPTKPQG